MNNHAGKTRASGTTFFHKKRSVKLPRGGGFSRVPETIYLGSKFHLLIFSYQF